MRISDWSSDVCSSDLHQPLQVAAAAVDIDPGHRTSILAAQHRRAVAHLHAGDGAERDLLARRRQDRQASEFADTVRSEEHTSELQSLMRTSYAVFCLKKKKKQNISINKISHNIYPADI